LEKVAYYAAHDLYCINRPTEKIAMPELFDLIAGSETGAIIAATLVIPNDDPKT
jgi:patatin-like phospholipase/acyl hydrolase